MPAPAAQEGVPILDRPGPPDRDLGVAEDLAEQPAPLCGFRFIGAVVVPMQSFCQIPHPGSNPGFLGEAGQRFP